MRVAFPDLFPGLMPRKYCSQCDTKKPICLFYDDRGIADGKDTLCMKCRQERNRIENYRYKPRPSGRRPFEEGMRALRIFN